MSDYTWLESAAACTVAATPATLLRYCAAMGVPRVWMADTTRHFKTRALQLVGESLCTSHRCVVVSSMWTNGTVGAHGVQTNIVYTFKRLKTKGVAC